MNVLFLYNHPHHAAPLLRCQQHLPEYGVTLRPRLVKDNEHLGGRVNADAVLLQEPPVHEELFDCGCPVILLERIDGAQLRAARRYLPRVAGVIKGYAFDKRNTYNTTCDRAHIEILARTGVQCDRPRACSDPPDPQLSPDDMAKIRVGYGFGSYDGAERFAKTFVDLDAERPYDVHFAGVVEYQQSEIETHRRLALEAARTWGELHPERASFGAGRVFSQEEYPVQLLRSKTVLGPWGWGESCHRDWEAWALGCVLIKPLSDYVECWPRAYVAGNTYVPCKPDFSDAHKQVDRVIRHWDTYRRMRELTRAMAVEAWGPEGIAQQMAGAIKSLLGNYE